MVDTAFYKSMNHGGFGRSIMCRKGKSITRISIYSNKDKALSFTQRKWSSVVNLSPARLLLVTLRSGVISGAQCCFSCWQIWHSATAVAKSALVNESPCCQALSTEQVFLSTWLLNSSPALDQHLHGTQISSHSFTCLEKSSHILFPRCLSQQISDCALSKSLII